MTDTPHPWDRRAAESDPAYEAFAAYLETGSLLDAYRQRSGKAQGRRRHVNKPSNNLTGGISRCGLGKVPAREYHSKTTAKLQHGGNISLTELKGETEWNGLC